MTASKAHAGKVGMCGLPRWAAGPAGGRVCRGAAAALTESTAFFTSTGALNDALSCPSIPLQKIFLAGTKSCLDRR